MTPARPAAAPDALTSHLLPTDAPDTVTSHILPTGVPDAVTSHIPPSGTSQAGPGLTPPSQADGQADEQADDQAHVDLPAVVTASRDARHFTTARMKTWGLPPHAILHAKTIVAELVTNAYQATRSAGTAGCISLTLRRLPGQIVIEVSDNAPGLPVKSDATNDTENGRGLHMVEAMSQEWGCKPRRCGGKVVYAIVRVPP